MSNICSRTIAIYELNTILFSWLDSGFMEFSEIDFSESIEKLCANIKRARPTNLLIDFSHFEVALSHEIIYWTCETLMNQIKEINIKKVGIVLPNIEFYKNPILMIFNNEFIDHIEYKMFECELDSLRWIKNQNSKTTLIIK